MPLSLGRGIPSSPASRGAFSCGTRGRGGWRPGSRSEAAARPSHRRDAGQPNTGPVSRAGLFFALKRRLPQAPSAFKVVGKHSGISIGNEADTGGKQPGIVIGALKGHSVLDGAGAEPHSPALALFHPSDFILQRHLEFPCALKSYYSAEPKRASRVFSALVEGPQGIRHAEWWHDLARRRRGERYN